MAKVAYCTRAFLKAERGWVKDLASREDLIKPYKKEYGGNPGHVISEGCLTNFQS